METQEYREVDKAEWGPGPWQDEPDKRQWQDAATGLPCLIVRGPVGALCGYVGVPVGHPAYGLSYDGLPDEEFQAYSKATREKMRAAFAKKESAAENHETVREALMDFPERPAVVPGAGELIAAIDVHGGLTYAAPCSDSICHVPGEGEPDNVWWFGFDCAHAYDLCPQVAVHRREIAHLMPPMPPRLKEAMEADHMRDVYRDVAYVTAECASLAEQLAEIKVNE